MLSKYFRILNRRPCQPAPALIGTVNMLDISIKYSICIARGMLVRPISNIDKGRHLAICLLLLLSSVANCIQIYIYTQAPAGIYIYMFAS